MKQSTAKAGIALSSQPFIIAFDYTPNQPQYILFAYSKCIDSPVHSMYGLMDDGITNCRSLLQPNKTEAIVRATTISTIKTLYLISTSLFLYSKRNNYPV